FAAGDTLGTYTVHGTPSACAAAAIPAPWFPALLATTPFARSSAPMRASTFVAPRNLNEPVCWSHSHLSHTSPPKWPLSVADACSGVRAVTPARRLAAARTWAAVGRG